MSKCISREGEYSDHRRGAASEFTCDRCWAFDEDAALEAITLLRAALDSERPLVVIDPEDREAVERLTNAYLKSDREGAYDAWWQDMQDALRIYADPKPPKPEEPTGLGAVVEDAEGEPWVLCPADGGDQVRRAEWVCHHSTGPYSAIDAVKVLSEGVTP